MKYGRFIDEIRMITEKVRAKGDFTDTQIKARIYPRIKFAANNGRNKVIYYPFEDQTISNYYWVADNWEAIKSHFEKQGFKCQHYEETNEYHIMW